MGGGGGKGRSSGGERRRKLAAVEVGRRSGNGSGRMGDDVGREGRRASPRRENVGLRLPDGVVVGWRHGQRGVRVYIMLGWYKAGHR